MSKVNVPSQQSVFYMLGWSENRLWSLHEIEKQRGKRFLQKTYVNESGSHLQHFHHILVGRSLSCGHISLSARNFGKYMIAMEIGTEETGFVNKKLYVG